MSNSVRNGEAWGCYHEMGHNVQDKRWTPQGTGEVTNNIFAIFLNNKVELYSTGCFIYNLELLNALLY